eukprot:5584829-Amphidinium_carterae.1
MHSCGPKLPFGTTLMCKYKSTLQWTWMHQPTRARIKAKGEGKGKDKNLSGKGKAAYSDNSAAQSTNQTACGEAMNTHTQLKHKQDLGPHHLELSLGPSEIRSTSSLRLP